MQSPPLTIIRVVFLLANWMAFVVHAAELRIERTLTEADGLASDTVLAILEDNHGTLWFGTTEGVTRYDGESFRTFTTEDGLASNTIGLIFEDKKGMLWFGDGILSNILERRKPVDMSFMEMSLSDLAKLPLAERIEGTVGTAQPKGLSRYDGHEFRIVTTPDGRTSNIVDVFEDETSTLWFATGYGVSQYDREQFNNIIVDGPMGLNVLPEEWNDVRALVQDTAGNFWFGSDAGITYYNVRTSQAQYFAVNEEFKPFVEMGPASSAHVNALEFDEHENLWIGGTGLYEQDSGIRRYDGNELVTFPTSDQLPMNNIHDILQDSKGNLWFVGEKMSPPLGNTGVGISVYNGKTFQNFNTADGFPHARVWSVFESKNGKLWFATEGGVAVGVYFPSSDTDNERAAASQ